MIQFVTSFILYPDMSNRSNLALQQGFFVPPLAFIVSTNHMPKESRQAAEETEGEELVIIKTCCNCNKNCTHKTQKRKFSSNRKVPSGNISKFNELMTKPRQRMKKSGETLCDKCHLEFLNKINAEKRALDKKLDLEIDKNTNIDAEEPETEENDFKEDGTLTNTFLQAIVGNLPFQIQISRN
jgi:hypothetical protein